jgi:hypothetical protein
VKPRKVIVTLEMTTDLPLEVLRRCRLLGLCAADGRPLGNVRLDQAPKALVAQPVKPAPKGKR